MRQVILILVFFSQFVLAQDTYYKAVFMEISKAEKKWGTRKFVIKDFKNAKPLVRASMAVDIIKNKKLVGQDILKLRENLGEPDGYLIQPRDKKNKESWQLVLIPDANLVKVKEVKINKKCCFETPAWVK